MMPIIRTVSVSLLLLTLSLPPAFSATIRVPANQPTIQAGIVAAEAGDRVLVAPGTYFENIDFLGKPIIVESEAGAELTAVDGHRAGPVVLFDKGETVEAVIHGFTIRNGASEDGGGIVCRESSPTIVECRIEHNIANDDGGGIYSSNASPTLDGCTLTNNVADDGGGILYRSSSPTITNCDISENVAFDKGGGIFSSSSSEFVIENCTINDNRALVDDGGGIAFWSGSNGTIRFCTLIGNDAHIGGGISCISSSPTIESCTISESYVDGYGAGVYTEHSSPIIDSCTVSDNVAGSHGSGLIFDQPSHPVVTNTLIVRNSTTGPSNGGGIRCYSGTEPLIAHCTIAHNNVGDGGGGGILSLGYWKGRTDVSSDRAVTHATIVNCIFWGNYAAEGPDVWVGNHDAELTISYSDVPGGEEGVFVAPSCRLHWLDGNINADPLFVGGGDYHLAAGSPCINAGTDAGVLQDMDGDPRPGVCGFDMGSDEYTPTDCWDCDGDGYDDAACGGDDCDDFDSDLNPGAAEACVGALDEDCDGLIDGHDPDCGEGEGCLSMEEFPIVLGSTLTFLGHDGERITGTYVAYEPVPTQESIMAYHWVMTGGYESWSTIDEGRREVYRECGGPRADDPPCINFDPPWIGLTFPQCFGDVWDTHPEWSWTKEVLAADLTITVPAGTFDGCVETVSYDDGDLRWINVHCPCIGNVMILDETGAAWELESYDLCPDADGDGYWDEDCLDALPCGGDCDDADPAINPDAVESFALGNCADGKDNDCDGLIDEADPDCLPTTCPVRIAPVSGGPIALWLIPLLALLLFAGRKRLGRK